MDNFRLILLLALAFVLYQLWQAWQQDYGIQPVVRSQETEAQKPAAPASAGAEIPALPEAESSVPAAPPVEPALEAGRRIVVRTDKMRVEIDTKGGDIRRVDLLSYPVSLDTPDIPFTLLTDTPPQVFVAQSGLIGKAAAPDHHQTYTTPSNRYRLGDGQETLEVPLTWISPEGVTVRKVYAFHRDRYLVDVRYEVVNSLEAAWKGRLYSQLQRNEPPSKGGAFFIHTYTGAVLHSEDEPYEKINFKDMEKTPVSRDVKGGWAAMIQHYFAAALVPGQAATNHYYTKALPGPRYAVGLVTPTVKVNPGDTGTLKTSLYLGPKEPKRLKAAVPGLDLTVDFGMLTILAEPMYAVMRFLHGWIGNWGWSIIVLTILIKLVFFPLSAASYKSMANMRRLQPRLQSLKEKYGDDRAKMNQAMMEMYKKEKINPLGGCLPVVVQIPFFISLYWVLLESVELRQAGFIFWINDLSVYDPYFVLPILMGVTMVIQQRLNPSPMDPVQQKVMMMLPIIFTVMFLFFPSGLVLYWFVNNTLSVTQQWVITRRYGQPHSPPAK